MSLRIPSPVALTKPEAYLAYKAGILSRGELKDKLLNPINNYEGWLAKWCELLETYPTNEDGTPQCLTDEEGLLAYLCGVTDRYPATNSRPDDARISAYIRYLVSARYARPDHPLNREEFYLSLIKTQFIPSGDPSSDIVIDGTTKAPFLDVKVYGDTLQNSYSGKNLAEVVCKTSAVQGITATYNSGTGVITLSGTATTVYSLPFQAIDVNIPAGTYTLKQYGTLSHGRIGVNLRRADNTQITEQLVNISALQNTFTLTEDAKKLQLLTGGHQANESVSGNIQVLLVAGTTAGDFEPFVGGIPAPSPSYPQPISIVTGRQIVNVEGKNLWNGEFGQGQTYNPTTTNRITTTQSPALRSGQTYTVSAFNLPSGFRYAVALFANPAYPGSNPGTAVFDSGWKTSESFSFTPSSDCYFAVVMSRTDNASLTPSDVSSASYQLELGSSSTSYQAYTARDYEVNLGKNLLDIVAGTKTDAGVECSKGNGTASAIGTSARAAYAQAMNLVGTMISQGNYPNYGTITEENSLALPSGTYTLSATISNTGNTNGGLFIGVGDVGSRPASGDRLSTTGSTSITLADGQRLYLSIWYEGTSTNKNVDLSVSNIQLEQGATATSYAPYFTPIEFAGVGEIQPDGSPKYCDTIKRVDEKWYIEKQIGRVVLDGSEDGWTFQPSNAPFRYRLTGSYATYDDASTFISDYFQSVAWDASWVNYDYLMSLNSKNILVFRYTGISTLEDFKTWLGTHPTTVYYALATPTTTEITNQSLIDQLNALKQGGAEEGTTYIKVSATDPNLPAKLYVEAPKYD